MGSGVRGRSPKMARLGHAIMGGPPGHVDPLRHGHASDHATEHVIATVAEAFGTLAAIAPRLGAGPLICLLPSSLRRGEDAAYAARAGSWPEALPEK